MNRLFCVQLRLDNGDVKPFWIRAVSREVAIDKALIQVNYNATIWACKEH